MDDTHMIMILMMTLMVKNKYIHTYLLQFKLLEKHKDYVIRANDYKKKQTHITR